MMHGTVSLKLLYALRSLFSSSQNKPFQTSHIIVRSLPNYIIVYVFHAYYIPCQFVSLNLNILRVIWNRWFRYCVFPL